MKVITFFIIFYISSLNLFPQQIELKYDEKAEFTYEQHCGFLFKGFNIIIKLEIFERTMNKIKFRLTLKKSMASSSEKDKQLIIEGVAENDEIFVDYGEDESDECSPGYDYQAQEYFYKKNSCELLINLSIYSDRVKIYDIKRSWAKKYPEFDFSKSGTLRRVD